MIGDIGPDPDAVIAAMVRVIVERWDPLQVVLFGSRTCTGAHKPALHSSGCGASPQGDAVVRHSQTRRPEARARAHSV